MATAAFSGYDYAHTYTVIVDLNRLNIEIQQLECIGTLVADAQKVTYPITDDAVLGPDPTNKMTFSS